jgi:hypothetical protein
MHKATAHLPSMKSVICLKVLDFVLVFSKSIISMLKKIVVKDFNTVAVAGMTIDLIPLKSASEHVEVTPLQMTSSAQMWNVHGVFTTTTQLWDVNPFMTAKPAVPLDLIARIKATQMKLKAVD